MIYSYIRVSTDKQEFLRQEIEIQNWCKENDVQIDEYFKEKITGTTFDREEYNRMKNIAKTGDTIIVKEIDRLGRDWDGIKEEWNYYEKHDINVIVTENDILSKSIYDKNGDIDLAAKFAKNIALESACFGATLEHVKNSRRTREALRAKKEMGIKLGRPVNTEADKTVCELYIQGMNKSDIAFYAGVSRPQVYIILRRNHLM